MKSHSVNSVLMSEDGGLLLIILLTTIGAWLAPDDWHYSITLPILGLGVFFDLISLAAHVSTLISNKYYSGFPGVGGFFYCWFIISSRFSLVGSGGAALPRVLLFKVADAVLLLGLHVLCQSPMGLRMSREDYD